MREATGGALLIKIMLTFIAIYISFLAISINYSLAFRVKNKIISIVEVNEGWEKDSPADEEIEVFLGQVGYTKKGNKWYDIVKISTDRGPYYRVTTYISFEFPVVRMFFTFPITGETKIIYNKS